MSTQHEREPSAAVLGRATRTIISGARSSKIGACNGQTKPLI